MSREINEKAGYHYNILFAVLFVSTVFIAIGFAFMAPVFVLVFWGAHHFDWKRFKEKSLWKEVK